MSKSIGRRGLFDVGGVAVIAIAIAIGLMATATAASDTIGVKSAHVGSKIEPIAVTAKGVTVYTLSGDSATHQECTMSSGCFGVWPPVKAGAKPTKAAGVSGKLGTFKRNGFIQVTLNGHPLYTYVADGNRPGKASGDGVTSFGGTWHVVTEGRATHASRGVRPDARG